MFDWIISNGATILTVSLLLIIVIGIVIKMIRSAKSGKPNCGCDCDGCAMSDSCKNNIRRKT